MTAIKNKNFKFEVAIINKSKQRLPRRFVQAWPAEMVPLLNRSLQKQLQGKTLTLVFLDQAPAKKINWQFRGKNYATDVLSFAAIEPEALGELLLCPQVIKKQAHEHKLSFNAELGYMLIHGVLHLLGYEHEGNVVAARKMFRLQDRLFERMCQKFKLQYNLQKH